MGTKATARPQLAKWIHDNGKPWAKFVVYQALGFAHGLNAQMVVGRFKTFKEAKTAFPDAKDERKATMKKDFIKMMNQKRIDDTRTSCRS